MVGSAETAAQAPPANSRAQSADKVAALVCETRSSRNASRYPPVVLWVVSCDWPS
jgi:hypothetical protein